MHIRGEYYIFHVPKDKLVSLAEYMVNDSSATRDYDILAKTIDWNICRKPIKCNICGKRVFIDQNMDVYEDHFPRKLRYRNYFFV